MCQKRTLDRLSIDQLIGHREHCRRDREVERVGGLEVDDKLVLIGRLDWEIARLLAMQNAIDEIGCLTEFIRLAWAICGEAAIDRIITVWKNRRYPMAVRRRDNRATMSRCEYV